MNSLKQNGFSRYERNGVILLVILIILSIVCKKYVVQCFVKEIAITTNDQQKIAILNQQISDAKTNYNNSPSNKNAVFTNNTDKFSKSKSYEKNSNNYFIIN